MECCPVTQKKEIPLLTGKWMQLKDMMLSEISQAQKGRPYMLSLSLSEAEAQSNRILTPGVWVGKGWSGVISAHCMHTKYHPGNH